MNIVTLLHQFSLLICILSNVVADSCWHREKTFAKRRSKLFVGHIIEETHAVNIFRCTAHCLRILCCNSVNYHGPSHRCVLGNATGEDPSSESAAEGWTLLQQECVPNSCLNNADCTAACKNNGVETFTCQCMAGTYGRRCHITQECNVALGMETTAIPNALITASSSADSTHLPHRARLNLPAASWTAATSDTAPWLKVELLVLTDVTGVVTQGDGESEGGWVTKFKLSYTDATDRTTQVAYEDFSGEEKIFSGNTDVSSEVRHFLDPIIQTRSLTFLMLEWVDKCSARVEIVGCYTEDSDWLLAFKGRAETGKSIYDAWTSLTNDSTQVEEDRALGSSHHYRDNVIFHLWNNLSITEVKLTLHTLEEHVEECLVMRFNGAGSDVKNWFRTANILQSPWTDLHQGATTQYGSMDGAETSNGWRRFLFDLCTYNTCPGDCGWLIVAECAPTCSCTWEGPHFGKTVLSNILYCKKTTACNWYAAGEIGLADVLTIHVKF